MNFLDEVDFYALEQLIIHSFQARVCALLWCRLAQSRPEGGLELGLAFWESASRNYPLSEAGFPATIIEL